MKDDAELWLEFIKRDIPQWGDYALPENPDCWYDVYCSLIERVQKSVEEDAERLKMALDGIKSERAKHSAKFVTDRRRLPRERPTTRQRYALHNRKMRGISPFSSGTSSRADTIATKRKNSIFSAPKMNPALAVPTKQLNSKATQVKHAPLSLIEDHRRPSMPISGPVHKSNTPILIAPGRSNSNKSIAPSSDHVAITPSLREREAKLRELTTGNSGSKSSILPPTNATSSAASQSTPKESSLLGARPSVNKAAPPSSTPREPAVSPSTEERAPGKLQAQSGTSAADESSSETVSKAAARRPVIKRKRSAPSIFIQPKKRKSGGNN